MYRSNNYLDLDLDLHSRFIMLTYGTGTQAMESEESRLEQAETVANNYSYM